MAISVSSAIALSFPHSLSVRCYGVPTTTPVDSTRVLTGKTGTNRKWNGSNQCVVVLLLLRRIRTILCSFSNPKPSIVLGGRFGFPDRMLGSTPDPRLGTIVGTTGCRRCGCSDDDTVTTIIAIGRVGSIDHGIMGDECVAQSTTSWTEVIVVFLVLVLPESYNPSRETTTMDEPVPSIFERAFLTATAVVDDTFAGTDATTTTMHANGLSSTAATTRPTAPTAASTSSSANNNNAMLQRRRLRILRFVVGVSNPFLPLRKRPERIMAFQRPPPASDLALPPPPPPSNSSNRILLLLLLLLLQQPNELTN